MFTSSIAEENYKKMAIKQATENNSVRDLYRDLYRVLHRVYTGYTQVQGLYRVYTRTGFYTGFS